MPDFYLRDTCRLCGSHDLQLVLPLRDSPLCDAYVKEQKTQSFYPLNLHHCKNCGFVQIDTVVDPEIIYRDYIYVTTSSSGLNKHFDQYAKDVCQQLKLEPSKLVIDIGSNDGTLLRSFKAKGHKVLGVEPSVNTAHEATASGIETLPNFFSPELAAKIVDQYGFADVVTVNNLFANIDDLSEFTSGIEHVLGDGGVLIVESSYLLDMINNMVFDFIYHEHLSYFSILPLSKFFKKFGMHLIHLEKVPTKGGSLRYFWAKENSKWSVTSNVKVLTEREQAADINLKIFRDFQSRIDVVQEQLIGYLDAYSSHLIVGYGASATSTTLISHFQLNKYLTYLVDDNPGKVGTYSPGFHIPVCNSAELQRNTPDTIIILAWRYKDQILKRLPRSLSSAILVPLPNFEIL
ncbi:MAG: class I SAM-dependent methyltransferase [Cyanobacteria bacterium P01_A01_bin.123]